MSCLKKFLQICAVIFFSSLTRMSSASSTESMTSPLQLLQKDESTGEYIVRMSQAEFDRLANQPRGPQQQQVRR